jgi:hypothetical protein
MNAQEGDSHTGKVKTARLRFIFLDQLSSHGCGLGAHKQTMKKRSTGCGLKKWNYSTFAKLLDWSRAD